jgi:hypothetical protein
MRTGLIAQGRRSQPSMQKRIHEWYDFGGEDKAREAYSILPMGKIFHDAMRHKYTKIENVYQIYQQLLTKARESR